VAEKGAELGIAARANTALTDITRKVERGALDPAPHLLTELRLN
jgi:2-dehydropantoate 2-reductase